MLKYGTIKALGIQHMAILVNFVSYYIIALPLAYGFAFKKIYISEGI